MSSLNEALRLILWILDVIWEAQKSFHNLVPGGGRIDSAILTSISQAVYQVSATQVNVLRFEFREFKD